MVNTVEHTEGIGASHLTLDRYVRYSSSQMPRRRDVAGVWRFAIADPPAGSSATNLPMTARETCLATG